MTLYFLEKLLQKIILSILTIGNFIKNKVEVYKKL